MKIDAHQHFWKYSADEYGWLNEEMSALRRDLLPEHLQVEIARAGIDGVVSVQARQSVGETDWLLSLADANPFVKGVVGWVPLAEPGVRGVIEKFSANPKLRSVRHVVQEEPDNGFLLRRDFNAGVSVLKDFNLAYDILIFERQLPPAIEFVDRHPGQVFVLDHLAKPRVGANEIEPWRKNIRELARRKNVFCKISGLVTEADWKNWTEAQLQPYLETALESFGPKRLMFGSDWPVCLAATTYPRWVEIVQRFAAKLSGEERDWLFGRTAITAYELKI